METRSKVNKLKELQMKKDSCIKYPAIYEVNIDFDEASAAWKENKKSIGNGQYKYVCIKDKIDGNKCGKVCYKDNECCWIHRKNYSKQ